MKLIFQNSRGEERVIAEPSNREEVNIVQATIYLHLDRNLLDGTVNVRVTNIQKLMLLEIA